MSFFKELLVCSVPAVAVGGTGVGIWQFAPKIKDTQVLNVWSGIKVVSDANPSEDATKDLIRQAGLNCGDATEEINCNIGSSGLNIDLGGEKKEGFFPAEEHNGNIKFRITSAEDNTYRNNFRFTVTDKPIKLVNKSEPKETIILEKYENFEVVKEDSTEKVYLTRKFTKGQWIKKSLGLPQSCDLPTKVSINTFDYRTPTCTLSKDQIKQIKFDGKSEGGPTTTDNVKLYIHKVHDTQTFPEGYKFTFHPSQEVKISDENKLIKDVWWDFRLKKQSEEGDEFALERVWKSTEELLKAVGLTCAEDKTCTITEGSLKLKSGIDFMMKGKRTDDGSATLKIEKERSGHYEGLRFSVHGGDITVENSASPDSTILMQEMEIFHIRKEDSRGTYHVLARKHNLWEMIPYHLGLNAKDCYLPYAGKSKECIIEGKTNNNPLGKIKFHDGSGKKTITNNTNELLITITSLGEEEKSTYPYGYKFTLSPDVDMKIGDTTLNANNSYDFKIKKGEGTNGPDLYLEKVS